MKRLTCCIGVAGLLFHCAYGYRRHGLPTTVQSDFIRIDRLVILPVVAETPVTQTIWDNATGPFRAEVGEEDAVRPPQVLVSPGKTLRDTRIVVPYGKFLVRALDRHRIELLAPSRVSEAIPDLYVLEIEQFSVREGPRDRLNLFSKLHLLRYSARGNVVFERIYVKSTDKADAMDLGSNKPFVREEINRIVQEHCNSLVDQIMAESRGGVGRI